MVPHDDLINTLMIKYARREKLTDKEMRLLEKWCRESPENQQLVEAFGDPEWVKSELAKLKQAPMEEIWLGINKYLDTTGAPDDRGKPNEWKETAPDSSHRLWGWKRFVPLAAASIVCVVSISIFHDKQRVPDITDAGPNIVKSAAHDLVAGDNEVVLTGNNDSNIELNAKPNGTLVQWTMGNYARKTGSNQLALYGWGEQATDEGMKPLSVRARLQSDTVWKAVAVGKNCAPYFVRLPDGSDVWLAGGTRLWYAVGNGKDPATYIVEGKALFDVQKDASRIFTVRTVEGGKVEVLGTSFLVETSKEKGSLVRLLSGSVRAQSGVGIAILKPGQEAAMGRDRVDVLPWRDSLAAMAWVHSSLYFQFDSTNFRDAVEAVASWYGYVIDNPKKLEGLPITDHLRKDPTPDRVVSIIGQIERGVLYIWVKDRVIHVSSKPAVRE